MKSFLIFGLGLIVGIGGMALFWRPSRLIEPGQAIEKGTQVAPSFEGSGSRLSALRLKAETSPGLARSLKDIKSEIRNYTYMDPTLDTALSDLTKAEANALSRSLQIIDERIREHEIGAARVEEVGDNRAIVIIPPLSQDGAIRAELENEVREMLGDARAERLLGAFGRSFEHQLCRWGEAEQRITINFDSFGIHVVQELTTLGDSSGKSTSG